MIVRNISALAALFLFVNTIDAQFQKGAMILDGNFNLILSDNSSEQSSGSLESTSEGRNLYFYVSPSLGVFMSSNDLIGGRLGYEIRSFKSEGTTEQLAAEQLVFFGPHYSRYTSLTEKLYLRNTARATFGIGSSHRKVDGDKTEEGEILEFNLRIDPGIVYFLSNRFALSAGIGSLSYDWRESKTESTINDQESMRRSQNLRFSANANSFNLGFSYFLGNSHLD